jgi:hypothetical protein
MSKLSAIVVVWLSTTLVAQSPATAPKPLPPNYTVELDNAYVRVTRASFKPHETVAVHLHPTFPTVYVYLTDGGPMRFIHITPSYTVMRAPVRTGGVRYNRNWHDETHVIEYLGDIPTEYLRVEMKTVPDQEHRDVRMAPEDMGPIEDAQVRVSRHQCAAAVSCALPAGPALVVTIDTRSFLWIQPGEIAGVVNGNGATSQIWIELKTQPNEH